MSHAMQRGCPECEGRLRAEGDETVCAECGLVVAADRIDRGPEWRSFPDKDTFAGYGSIGQIRPIRP